MEKIETIFKQNLFQDKTVIVTGGATGIGYAIAKLVGSLGAHVILVSRTEENLKIATDKLHNMNFKVNYVIANIRDEEDVKYLFNQIEENWGTANYLVNNAGGQFAAHALDISSNGFRAIVDLNLQGTWHMCSAFAHQLIKANKAGKIINIVLSLKNGMPGMVHSGAARAGVVNMTKTLAYEWAKYGININAIAPGTVKTEALDQYDKDKLDTMIDQIPIKRMATTKEVAEAVTYLLSDASNYITGTTLEIDGGDHLTGAKEEI